MARYRLLEKTFINNMLCEKGDIVEHDGPAGSTMQPVDTDSKVAIPENWQEENGLKRIALARSLGAPKQRMSGAEADLWISNELENRELAKQQAKTAPAKPSLTDKLFTPTPKPAEPAQVTKPFAPSVSPTPPTEPAPLVHSTPAPPNVT